MPAIPRSSARWASCRRARCCWSRTWRRPRRWTCPIRTISPTPRRPRCRSTTRPSIVAALRRRFPAIHGPKMEDICYATTNRQAAVKAIAPQCDALVVIGAPNSSNSMRLVEVAANYGCRKSRLVQRAVDMDWEWLEGASRLGITAGASAPETLVDELIAACRERYDVTVEEVRTTEENVVFKLPRRAEWLDGGLYRSQRRRAGSLSRRVRHRRARFLQGHRRRRRELQLPADHHQGPLLRHALRKARRPEGPAVLPRPDGPSRRARPQLPAADPRPRRQGAAHAGRPARRHHDLPAGAVAAPHDCRAIAGRSARRWRPCTWPAATSS